MDKIGEFLQHYVEQPYDPVKAHEYYLKNRDLKGRTTSGMSQLQKEAWDYSKSRVDSDKKQSVDANKVANDQKIEAFQQEADATRARITEKLKALAEKIASDSKAERTSIANKVKSDIANVEPIPDGVTGEERARLLEKRKKEIADIRDTASSDRSNVTTDATTSRQNGSNSASDERDKARTDLKSVITKAKDDYAKAKETLDSKYETIYAKEYRNVLNTVAGNAPKVKTPAKAKTKTAAKAKTPKAAKTSDSGIIYYTPAEMAANKKS